MLFFSRVPVGDLFVKVAFVIDFSSHASFRKSKTDVSSSLLQQSLSLTPRGKSEEAGDKRHSGQPSHKKMEIEGLFVCVCANWD